MVASKFNEAKTEIRRIFKENPSDIFKQVEISNLLDTYLSRAVESTEEFDWTVVRQEVGGI